VLLKVLTFLFSSLKFAKFLAYLNGCNFNNQPANCYMFQASLLGRFVPKQTMNFSKVYIYFEALELYNSSVQNGTLRALKRS